jgi:hypothetical protein
MAVYRQAAAKISVRDLNLIAGFVRASIDVHASV